MKLSTKDRYALSAMLELTQAYSQKNNLTAAQIASLGEIPLPYLEQILSKLKKQKLVVASRGPSGGYLLARDPSQISLFDIISAGRPFAILNCLLSAEDCLKTKSCKSRVFWHNLNDKIINILQKTTLENLCP